MTQGVIKSKQKGHKLHYIGGGSTAPSNIYDATFLRLAALIRKLIS